MPHRPLLRSQVLQDVTSLVNALAGYYWPLAIISNAPTPLVTLCQRARDLLAPIDDYETAARAAGWQDDPGDTLGRVVFDTTRRDGEDESFYHAESWEAACQRMNIEPEALAVAECWSVTEWMADRLEETGQRVAHDFAGLIVWARTGTNPLHADETLKGIWRRASDDFQHGVER
jgi:hypothetical protein